MQVRPAMQLFDGFGDEMGMAGEIKVRQGIFCHHGAPRLVVAGPAKCQVTYHLTVLKAFCRDADRESLLFAYSLPEIHSSSKVFAAWFIRDPVVLISRTVG